MTSVKSTSSEGVKWNLSDLYEGPDDPKLEDDINLTMEKAEAFREQYKNKVEREELSPQEFKEAMKSYEEIYESIYKITSFANLYHAADTQDPERGALRQKAEQIKSKIKNELIFFQLEWQSLSDEEAEIYMDSDELEHYKSYLNHWRRYTPYMLSEFEEQIIESLQNTGKEAFKRLFDQTMGNLIVDFEYDGESYEMVLDQALSVLYEDDREKRKIASDSITKSLKEENDLLNFIFNNIVQNHSTICEFRDYPDPMTPRNLDNRVDMETVDALLSAVMENTHLVEEFYELKRQICDLDELYDYDRYSPLPGSIPEIDFEESKTKVLEAYEDFSLEMKEIAKKFFKNDWIDAEIREGKRGGAFSASTVPSVHPYIMLNFNDRTSDMITMAHELGHGVHQYLARDQGALQQSTPLTTAEMASVFGEMLLFDKLMDEVEDEETELRIIGEKLQRDFATVFRQVIMTKFEQKLHQARREKGELNSEQINNLWLETNREEFGDSVILREEYGWWWSYILHFVHYPFYCYAYAYGNLLVLALYDIYKERGEDFVPEYLKILRKGGSEDPKDLLETIGIDTTDPKFWDRGLNVLKGMMKRMKKLAENNGKVEC